MRSVLLLLLASAAEAQLPTTPEVFGQVGVMRFGGDEGSLGSAASFGGALLIPLPRKLAFDIDVLTARVSPPRLLGDSFSERRVLLSPALLRRWGTTRFYGFAGGGVGVQVENSRFTTPSFSGSGTETGMTLHGKTGFVANLTGKLLLRTELFLTFRYVLPTVGVRAGIGYRF